MYVAGLICLQREWIGRVLIDFFSTLVYEGCGGLTIDRQHNSKKKDEKNYRLCYMSVLNVLSLTK